MASAPAAKKAAMTVITTRITVSPDGTVSTATPLPAGSHIARVELHGQPARQQPTEPLDVDSLPTHDFGPWPEGGVSLRREDLYGDDGR